jgi:DNA-binding response OmpR family regulator
MSLQNVLIVEDEVDLAHLYERWLTPSYDVTTVTDGESALARVDDETDVVVLDRMMPDVSGDRVLSEIRHRGLDCYVIVVSAVDPDWDVIAMGFDAYITKPMQPGELTDAIERVASRSSFEADVRRLRSLREKAALLRERKSNRELERNADYADLVAQIDDLTTTVERENERLLDDEEFVALIRDLERSRGPG